MMDRERDMYGGEIVGKPEGKGPLGRPRLRWEDIRMDLSELVRAGWMAK
jgi:hypothetical protein